MNILTLYCVNNKNESMIPYPTKLYSNYKLLFNIKKNNNIDIKKLCNGKMKILS